MRLEGDELRDNARCVAHRFHETRRREGHRPSDAELREQGRRFARGEDSFALYLTLASGPAGEEELMRQLYGELPPHDAAMILEGMRQGIKEEIALGHLPNAQIGPAEAGLALLILALSGNAESARRAIEATFKEPASTRANSLRNLLELQRNIPVPATNEPRASEPSSSDPSDPTDGEGAVQPTDGGGV